jgi:hypothetical protein
MERIAFSVISRAAAGSPDRISIKAPSATRRGREICWPMLAFISATASRLCPAAPGIIALMAW